MEDEHYKDEETVELKSFDNANIEKPNLDLSNEDIINNFFRDWKESRVASLKDSFKSLINGIQYREIYKNELFHQLNIINILRSMVEKSYLTSTKNESLNALTILIYKTHSDPRNQYDLPGFESINCYEFVISVIALLDSDHKPAFYFLSQLVLVSEEARNYLFEEFGVDILIDLAIESTQNTNEKEENIGYLYFELLANCCFYSTNEYPKIIEACSDALSSDISLDYFIPAVKGLTWIAENGMANEIYSNNEFSMSICKLLTIEDEYFLKLFLKLLLLINNKINFQMTLPPDALLSILHSENPTIFSLTIDLMKQMVIGNEGYSLDIINAGLLDAFADICENRTLIFTEMLIVLIETIAQNYGPPIYGPILPLTIPLLETGNMQICGTVVRLFYRFFTSCEDPEKMNEIKSAFYEENGISLVLDLQNEEEDLCEPIQNLLDILNSEEEDE